MSFTIYYRWKELISCETILSEYLPSLYQLISGIKENNYNVAEIIEWVDLRKLDVSKKCVLF